MRCRWPVTCCFVECLLDGKAVDVSQPHRIALPANSGVLALDFIDLAPLPADVVPMHPSTFAALRSLLLHTPVRTCACVQSVP